MKVGNSEVIVINDIDLKNKIIDYLFSQIQLSQYRYIILKTVKQIDELKNSKNLVSPNFKGTNFLTIFYKINGNNSCFLIDRRKMSYHKDKLDIKNLKIYKVKVMTSSSIFKGTIMDTKLIKTPDNIYKLLIKDCYVLMGSKYLDMEMQQKNKHLENIFNNHFSDNCCNNFTFCINRLFTYDKLDDLINKIIPECKIDIIGLIFFPIKSGISKIFIENNQTVEKNNTIEDKNYLLEEINDNTLDIITNFEKYLKSRKYSYYVNGKKKIFNIQKTNITDVYNLLENDKRFGIACIPNLKLSSYFQEKIKDNTSKKCECIFNSYYNSWIPVKLLK